MALLLRGSESVLELLGESMSWRYERLIDVLRERA